MPTSIATMLDRIRGRLSVASPLAHLRGMALRRKFTRAGIIVVQPGSPGVRVVNRGGTIACENVAFFPGVRLECMQGGHIFIGNGTYLNRGTEIIAQTEVTIGRNCKIAWDVVIMDTDQHGIGDRPPKTQPVRIGDNVWLGCRAIILKGVSIGQGAIIGAGAIVTRDVPAGAIVTGPAAEIRGFVPEALMAAGRAETVGSV